MQKLESKITSIENKYLKLFSDYCQLLFSNTHIPSHDHTHHLRVWNYSKEILHAISNDYTIDENLIESCLIASLFHDTGLTQNLSPNHGVESRKICSDFFNKNTIAKPENFDEISNAIEKHDDKDYKSNNSSPEALLSIICNADDLDAFGRIGVVRYTEIYLLRGININELPTLVIQNLDKRFLNFEKTYKSFTRLYEKHKERYHITKEFFQELIRKEL
jgi:HD superfamily phosphodiesterase